MIHIDRFGLNCLVSTDGLLSVQVDRILESTKLRVARFVYHNGNIVEHSNEEIDNDPSGFMLYVACMILDDAESK